MSRIFGSFFHLSYRYPFLQGIWVFCFGFSFMALSKLFFIQDNIEWYIAATALMFFTAGNPIIGIFRKKWLIYVLVSIISYFLLLFSFIHSATYFSMISINELDEFRQIFMAGGIFFFLITFLVAIYRGILNLLQNIE